MKSSFAVKFFSFFLMGLMCVVSLTVDVSPVNAADKVKLRFAHNQTDPTNPFHFGAIKLKEAAERESGNSLEIEVHAGDLGTSETELVDKIKLGAVDIAIVSPGLMTTTGITEIELVALPYTFQDWEHWERFWDGEASAELKQLVLDKSGGSFKIIGVYSAGIRNYLGKKGITSPEDLKGIKIRTQTSGYQADFWKSTGAIPTNVAWGEVYQAFQQKIIDATENAYAYMAQASLHQTENGKFASETKHDYSSRLVIMNGVVFNKLSDDQKSAFTKAMVEAQEAQRTYDRQEDAKYRQIMIDAGETINEVDIAPFKILAEEVRQKAIQTIGTAAQTLYEKIESCR